MALSSTQPRSPCTATSRADAPAEHRRGDRVTELDGRGPVIRVRADEQPDGAPGLAADITAESVAEFQLGEPAIAFTSP